MARTPMVTRTFQTTKAYVLCLDITTGESSTKEVVLSGLYPSDNKVPKACAKVIENDELKVVHVVRTETEEQLRGMAEQKFLELSEILPPRKTAKNESEDDN